MADLSTRLGPLALRNPVIAASCEFTMTEEGINSCVDAGAGAVVAKSINESPAAATQLDIADYALLDEHLRLVPWEEATGSESLFNRSGLAQAAVDEWVSMLGSAQAYAASRGSMIIGSVTVAAAEAAAELARRMAEVVPAIEINVGAPHGREGTAVRQITEADGVAHYARTVRDAVDCPLIVKLPGQASDIVGMAKAAADNGADVVGLIGRFNGFVPNLDTWEPELGSWGAIGGGWMLPISLYWVSKCFTSVSTPLIGTNGARDGLDLARFLLSGARAVEIASALISYGPIAITRMLNELDAYLEGHAVPAVDQIIGASVTRAKTYGELTPISPRPQPWTRHLR